MMKPLRILIVCAALTMGGSAMAQTTNCSWVGLTWTCQTNGGDNRPNPLGSLTNPRVDISGQVMQGFERGRQAREQADRDQLQREILELESARQQLQFEQASRYARQSESAPPARTAIPEPVIPQQKFIAPFSVRQEIGEFLKVGNCTAGVNKALEAGDIELATNVRAFCNGAPIQVNEPRK